MRLVTTWSNRVSVSLLAILGVTLLACTGSGGDDSKPTSSPEARATIGERVGMVLLRAPTAYAVAFKWTPGSIPAPEGQFFLRRSTPGYRWDEVPYAAGTPARQGAFEVLVEQSIGLQKGYSCTWNVQDSTTLRADCGEFAAGAVWAAFGAFAPSDEIVASANDRMILGDPASCFTTELSREYCFNAAGIPVYFRGNSGNAIEEIEAVSTTLEPQSVQSPSDLEARFPRGSSETPIEQATLPPELSVGEE
jgi:hypothetical protein